MANCSRVIGLIDMDCFYVQVEERDDPTIKGQPAAVVQYNAYKGGGLIAVNYEARAKGVGRHMRGDDAKLACPEILLVKVPELRGKADLTKYRTAGQEVIKVLSEFPTIVERASVDEAYLDLTEMIEERLSTTSHWDTATALQTIDLEYYENNFVLGYESSKEWMQQEMMSITDVKLAIGAEIVGQMRKRVFEKTGFRCSAGIAHNKVLAKLACGINKPNKQTVLPHSSVPVLFSTTKVKKVRSLGGKLGDLLVERLQCDTMADLAKFTENELSAAFGGKTASWLFSIARGYDDEPVTARQLPKSIGCNKNFNGPETLRQLDKMKHWIQQLSAEVVERLVKDFDMNNRKSKSLTLHVRYEDGSQISRSCGSNPSYNAERMTSDVYSIMENLYLKNPSQGVTSLGLIASKFEDELDSSTYTKIDSFFTKQIPKPRTPSSTITRPQEIVDTPSIPISTTSTAIASTSAVSVAPLTLTLDFFSRVDKAIAEIGTIQLEPGLSGIFNRNETPTDRDQEILQLGATPEIDDEVSNSSDVIVEDDTKQTSRNSPSKKFTKKCDRCMQLIVIWDFPTHMDYHFAKDLQREINGMPPLPNQSKQFEPVILPKRIKPNSKRTKTGQSGNGAKSSKGTPTSTIVTRPIESYFKPIPPAVNRDG